MRYIAHLDLMRTWERSLRRARLPLAYTQGFTPHARIALGAPLPVGTVGERELLDVWMSPAIAPEEFARRLAAVLPEGLTLLAAQEAAHELPSLQSQIRSATYEVAFAPDALDADDVRARLDALLALETLDWEEQRGAKTRRSDLRAAIRDLVLREEGERLLLAMDLELNEESTGRRPLRARGARHRGAPGERRAHRAAARRAGARERRGGPGVTAPARRALGALVALAAAGMLAISCNGGEDGETTAMVAPSATATATATRVTTATATPMTTHPQSPHLH